MGAGLRSKGRRQSLAGRHPGRRRGDVKHLSRQASGEGGGVSRHPPQGDCKPLLWGKMQIQQRRAGGAEILKRGAMRAAGSRKRAGESTHSGQGWGLVPALNPYGETQHDSQRRLTGPEGMSKNEYP